MPDPSKFREALASVRPRLAWVVVITKPNQEIIAKRELERQGFEVYLPMKLFEDKWKNVRSTAFFQRYLFARIDVMAQDWRRIFSTGGVTSLLGCTLERPPIGVAEYVIERIKAQEEAGYIRMMGEIADRKAGRRFGAGEVVRMSGSPLEAVFLEPVDSKRAVILVSLLGRESRLTVDLAKLRSATED